MPLKISFSWNFRRIDVSMMFTMPRSLTAFKLWFYCHSLFRHHRWLYIIFINKSEKYQCTTLLELGTLNWCGRTALLRLKCVTESWHFLAQMPNFVAFFCYAKQEFSSNHILSFLGLLTPLICTKTRLNSQVLVHIKQHIRVCSKKQYLAYIYKFKMYCSYLV